ncbi:hypothetical protein [Glutamicibacter sp.]|uniref:hypothetical protein n=1 Tax=Glutamicibacter sp. TaxID=1931995 RepID=UPI002B4A174E|nr:hypothetical protein [Glutamicibacter sp.]HJX78593.1 hypothetical protein [Glutamicibacter sp.]
MGMTPDDAIWASLNFEDLPVFDSAQDLSRYSIETHQGHNRLARTKHSRGFLRLAGPGVDGHQADAAQAFAVGIAFQKVITAFGSALHGAKASISKIAEQQTRLRLDGSPAPGSIIFNLVAASTPADELRPNGELFDKNNELLVDRSFDALNQVFSPSESFEDRETLVTQLEDLGPQAAKALRSFVTIVGDHYFDMELKWQQPLAPALHWSVPTLKSQMLRDFIALNRLDEVPVTLTGRLHTVSISNKWSLVSDEFGKITLDLADLTERISRSSFPAGSLVEANAMMTQSEGAGSKAKRDFRVTSLRALQD